MPVLFLRLCFRAAGLLADARRFARAAAQVVELRAAHIALALDLDRCDERRVGLEGALDALARGNLAHDERRVEAAIALGDHHPFECLHALSLAFDHVDVHQHGVARREVRDVLRQALDLFLLDGSDPIHVQLLYSRWNSPSKAFSSSLSAFACSSSGRLSQVRPSACFRRQRLMFSWCPDSSTSGTRSLPAFPAHTSGRVYCGQSSKPAANDSSSADWWAPSAPGNCRTTASISAIAASSPPESTKSPSDNSSSTRLASKRSSTPS